MAADSEHNAVVEPSFGWDPVVDAWRIVLGSPGPAGSTPLEHAGGAVLVDVVDGTVLEAIADTSDRTSAGEVSASAVTIWRRLFGAVVAGWLEQADGRHESWRFAPVDPTTERARALLGRLAIVERSLTEGRPSAWMVEAAQLGADLRLTSESVRVEAADSAELLDDELLAVIVDAGLETPIRTVLLAEGYDEESLPALLLASTPDRVDGVVDLKPEIRSRVRSLVERAASQASSWFDVQPRPLFAPTSTSRSAGRMSGPGDSASMGLMSASAVEPPVEAVQFAVQLVDLPADRVLDWTAASQGDTWAARVSFRGTAVPHLEADLIDVEGNVRSTALLRMESIGSGRVVLRATPEPGSLQGVPANERAGLVVRVRGVDLDPEVLALATPGGDARLHATAVACSAAGAGRWAVAGALEVTRERDTRGPEVPGPSVAGELRWVADRWGLASTAWNRLGDAPRASQCEVFRGEFNKLASLLDDLGNADPSDVPAGASTDRVSSPAGRGSAERQAEQLAELVGVGWSERVSRLLALTLAEIWVGRNPDSTTAALADRSARLAEFLGDHLEAASARTVLARQADLPDSQRRVAAHLALAHRELIGRRTGRDDELVAIAAGRRDVGGSQ